MQYVPYNYQKYAYDKILELNKIGLFLDMGLGKTVITLSAIDELIYNRFAVSRVLVIAPLRVAQTTWSTECKKWDHLKHLRISKIMGDKRKRLLGLYSEADVYIINRENVVWLANELSSGAGDAWKFDMVVIDELSSFKSSKAERFKALKKQICKSWRVVGLTGTPSPNGLIDLWSQLYLLDGGERLGRTLKSYRERYFSPDKRNQQIIFSYKALPTSEGHIMDKIKDICISMKAEDLLDLPERIDRVQEVILSNKEQQSYDDFEKKSFMQLEEQITALSAGALTNKLLQFANGAVYDEEKQAHVVHGQKLKALEEIYELSQGKPILCFYSFIHDLDRIKESIPEARKLQTEQDIIDWNEGKIPLLLAHPASAGHGLNLQSGGSIIVWFGLTWSLELYQQANARLHRQGQKDKVIIHHLITKNTMDETVMTALENKSNVQDAVLAAVKAKIGKDV